MKQKINIYTNIKSNIFFEQLFNSHDIVFKNIDEINNDKSKSEGGIIFLNNKTYNPDLFKKKLDDNFLLITNTILEKFNENNFSNISKPIPLNTVKSKINKFLSDRKIFFEDIEISDKKIINSKSKKFELLTDIENEILQFLIFNKSCAKDSIKNKILNIKSNIQTNSLESHLTRIRKKLDQIESKIIITSKKDNLKILIN